jgi:arginyl-tRNA synthetase
MIKVGREKIITFEVEKSLRFDGFTAAYLQYTGARINSVLKKSGFNKEAKPEFLVEPKEHELLIKLAKYPDIVADAGGRYEPSEVAKYLFELAQLFNDYYHSVPVLKTEAQIKAARLALLSATKQVLANGLDLLGIDFIEEM